MEKIKKTSLEKNLTKCVMTLFNGMHSVLKRNICVGKINNKKTGMPKN